MMFTAEKIPQRQDKIRKDAESLHAMFFSMVFIGVLAFLPTLCMTASRLINIPRSCIESGSFNNNDTAICSSMIDPTLAQYCVGTNWTLEDPDKAYVGMYCGIHLVAFETIFLLLEIIGIATRPVGMLLFLPSVVLVWSGFVSVLVVVLASLHVYCLVLDMADYLNQRKWLRAIVNRVNSQV